jgi:HSP20 family molecular chaperone IbpA
MSDNMNVSKRDQASSVTETGQTQSVPKQALAPAVDIAESGSGITLFADMPGVSKDRLTIKVEGDNLTIEGEAQIDVPENIELLHSEVRSPYFRRTFTLSRDLDPARIEATLRDGVLQMHIPKSEEARPKRIEVRVA